MLEVQITHTSLLHFNHLHINGCVHMNLAQPDPLVFFLYLFEETITTPQKFYGPFSGTTQVSRCQKRTSGLYGARED